jgi:aspartyl-tRNA(Asn)/glutamyl-tRNA(Gln) amidotransferase subunit A
MQYPNFFFSDYETIKAGLAAGSIDCAGLVQSYLSRCGSGERINAFRSIFSRTAMRRAEEIDRARRNGTAGSLAGMVLAVKDNLCWREGPTTCGSRYLESYHSPFDATALTRLTAADAVIIGKTNLDEFAMGSSTENSAFGPVCNPHRLDAVPGGSSGGSAAAVAAGFCTAALGSDTGGSIRQPAAFCGVTGLKPTYGRVSRQGLVAFASSLDQIGILARSSRDCAALLQVMGGYDPLDATSARVVVPDFHLKFGTDIRGVRIGLPREYFVAGTDPQILKAVKSAADWLQAAGATVDEVSLPHTDYAVAAYYIIATAEASANLARYDGLRYGRRRASSPALDAVYHASRSSGLGTEVKRRIMLGTYVLSSGYYDAYYGRAQKVRSRIRNDFSAVFGQVDLLLTPTTPTTAFAIGEKSGDPLQMYLSDVFTVSANLAGIPALSLPVGFDDRRLPIGMQLLAASFEEATLLRVADFLQKNYPPGAPDLYVAPAGMEPDHGL